MENIRDKESILTSKMVRREDIVLEKSKKYKMKRLYTEEQVIELLKNQREICSKQVSGFPNQIKIESEIEDDVINAPNPPLVEGVER